MTRMTDPHDPEKPVFSRMLGVLLGFGLVLVLYLIVDAFLAGPSSIPDSGKGSEAGRGDPTVELPRVGDGTTDPGDRRRIDPDTSDAPQYRLLCLDAETRQRIEGLRAFDLETRRDLGASNPEGLLVLPGIPAHRILLYGDGYLYRMLREQAGPALQPGQSIHQIDVYKDRYTLPLKVRTLFPEGQSKATRIRLRVWRSDGEAMDGASFPTALFGPDRRLVPSLRKAWLMHRILATMDPEMVLAMREAPAWVIGEPLLPLVLPLDGGRLRFAEAGPYVIRASTSDGLVARARVEIHSRQRGKVELRFGPGKELELLVQDPDGRPVPDARVYLFLDREGAETELTEGITQKNGEVSYPGLFGDERLRIRVEVSGYAIWDQQLAFANERQTLRLRPLVKQEWRFQVREWGSGKRLSGVRMSLRSEKAGSALTETTDGQGRIQVSLAMGETFRLELSKSGFVAYAEMIGGGAAGSMPTRFEILPESLERQAKLGLICLLEGRATRAKDGLVKLVVKDPGLLTPGPKAMRRYLSGHRPERHLQATVDAAGQFRLWTDQKGAATLILFSDSGQRTRDLLLVPGRVLHPKF